MHIKKWTLLTLGFFLVCFDTYAHNHSHEEMDPMHSMYGSYVWNRDSSGTSWQPQSTPYTGMMVMHNENMYMLQGYANQVYDNQGGPRGGIKNFNESMLMFMGQTNLSVGTLGFRSMFSLDPAMGKHGYPLLLQTGETANGRTPLIDHQHPHDFVMELAGVYSIPFANQQSVFLYGGLAGEPALGPPVFMMRWSGWDNPEAPITHHWLDSTHISYGVLTAGYIYNKIKLEISAFNGREPDQARWNIESPKFNSQSTRLSFNPSNDWSLQVSYGHLKSPEQLEPEINTNRITASAMYNKAFANNNWQTILAWGQDRNNPGHILNGYLLESAINFHVAHTIFGRYEHVQKDELFLTPSPLAESVFAVDKFSLGYLYEFPTWHHAKFGLGGLASAYGLPPVVNEVYEHPFSFMLFARASVR